MSAPTHSESRWLSRLRANADAIEAGSGDASWAIEFEGSRLTYGELALAVELALRSFTDLGLRRGEIVAILAPPSLAGISLLHGFLEAGIVMLPLNARLTESELIEALTTTRVKALWVESASEEGASRENARRIARVAAAAGCELVEFGSELVFDSAVPGRRPRVTRLGNPSDEAGLSVELQSELEARRFDLASKGASLILRTSGTTGRPKGALLSLSNLLASAAASHALLNTSAEDRWLLCMPIFHIGGLSILIRSVLDRSSVVVHPQFEAERVDAALAKQSVSCVSFVATMLQRLLDVRGERLAPDSLRLVLLGGGPATHSLLARADALGYPVAPTYGLTEAASQVATRPPGITSPHATDLAAGLEALPGTDLRIARGKSTPEGLEGEIELRGPTVMLGYLDDPAATESVLRGGWLSTGDFGQIDAEGRLRVLDRRSDLILSGGENIYPAEIESVLGDFSGVEEAAVVGRLDSKFGARPIAFVVLRSGIAQDVDALRRHCEANLARFKVPVEFYFRETLPRTPSGKLMRRALQDAEDPE